MEIGEPTAGRLATALAFILEGRSVGFGNYSIAVFDGSLLVYVDYPLVERNEDLAAHNVAAALRAIDLLLSSEISYRHALSSLPRRVSLVRSSGTADAEIAEINDGRLAWRD